VRSRAWAALFWATSILAALPLLVVRRAPFTDMPEHVAAIATIARLLPGGGGAPYEVSLGSSQYLVYHATGAVLARVVGDATLANRVLLAACALAWPISLRVLLRALGRDERLAIFGAMIVWNRALGIGFLPYFASVPVLAFALAAIVRQLDAPSARRGVVVALLALLLFYTHVSSYVLFALTAGAWTAWRAWRSDARARLAIAIALPLAPSAIAALAWWRGGSLATNGPIEHVARIPMNDAIHAMPIWCFDLWRSHLDEACAGAWWLAFAIVIAVGLRTKADPARLRESLFALAPFAVTAIVYLTTPFHVGAAGYLNVRLAPLVALFAVLGLRPEKGRPSTIALALAGAAAIVTAANATWQMRAVEREELGDDFDALLGAMRPHTRLAMLNFETRSSRMYFWPYVFAGSYHRANGGDVASYSFTELAHWPIHYRAGTAPPSRGPFWIYGPCRYRYREDGAYYDYVLVQGAVDPFAAVTPGPTFAVVARSGAFTLYARTGPEIDPSLPEGGPCPLRPPP
jgi:hypothetical protein